MDYEIDTPPQEDEDLLRPWTEAHPWRPEEVATAPKHVLLYGRRSVADPRDVSVGGQIAAMVEYCDTAGLLYDLEKLLFLDRHRSGRTMDGRAALGAMRAAVRTGQYSAIIVESLDRLTQNSVDAMLLKHEADAYDVAIHVAHGGTVDTGRLLPYALEVDREA